MTKGLRTGLRFLVKHTRGLLLPPLRYCNGLLRRLLAFTHWVQFQLEWAVEPRPEWFDHFIDQYYIWQFRRNPMPWERGIFNLLVMKPGCQVLDLCCGDGFNAYHFYSDRAGKVTAVDFDPRAIAHARRYFSHEKVQFLVGDVRSGFPDISFDNVVWDAAIEHFTLDEIYDVLRKIKAGLNPGGVLSGYTIVARVHGKSHNLHEHEFSSRQDLAELLRGFFDHVVVLETNYSDRDNLYYYASDSPLPFDQMFTSWSPAARASEPTTVTFEQPG